MKLSDFAKEFSGESVEDRHAIVVLTVSALMVLLMHYVFRSIPFVWGLGNYVLQLQYERDVALQILNANLRIFFLLWWVIGSVLCYLLIPFLLVKIYLKRPLSDYGLRFKGALVHYKLYAVLFIPVALAILAVSQLESFQSFYPIYQNAPSLGLFFVWEMLYLFQFFTLEFFYRGFLLHGIYGRFGMASIWIMVFPYFMIHFGKPWPEAVGAFVAGFVLGVLSLRSGSIMGGVILHIAVAASMDLCSLLAKL